MNLEGLYNYLSDMGDSISLEASDPSLPAELQQFLARVPGKRMQLMVQPGSIIFQKDKLSLSGTCNESWPVQGLYDVSISINSFEMRLDNDASPAISASAEGAVQLTPSASVRVALQSDVYQEELGWNMLLSEKGTGIKPMELLLLGKVGSLPFDIPDGLDFFDRALEVDPSAFQLTFYPNSSYQALYQFAMTAPNARWAPIPSILEIQGIRLDAFMMTHSTSALLSGKIQIKDITMIAGISLSNSAYGSAWIKPAEGEAFPGLASLAAWIGGQELSSSVSSGLEQVKFSGSQMDAAISSITLEFNWKTFSLNRLRIVSLLTLGALQMDVSLSLPQIELSGSLHGGNPVNVKKMLESLGLVSKGIPDTLNITEVEFHAQPSLSYYSLGMAVDHVWSIGPLTIQELSSSITYDGEITGAFQGTLRVTEKASFQLGIEYGGQASGWIFSGGTVTGTSLQIGELLALLADKFGIGDVPEPVQSLSLTNISLVYETQKGLFTFACEGDFKVKDSDVRLIVNVALSPASANAPVDEYTVQGTKGYNAKFSGQVLFSGLEFDIVFNIQNTSQMMFIATYSHAGEAGTIRLHDLVASISADTASIIPDSLILDLKDVIFMFMQQKETKQFSFAVHLGTSMSLSDLPVVGSKLPSGADLGVQKIQMMYNSADVTKEQVDAINSLLPANVTRFPQSGVTSGIQFGAQLTLGSYALPISLSVNPKSPSKDKTPLQLSSSAESAADTASALPAPSASSETVVNAPGANGGGTSSMTKWFEIQRSFGPVHFSRIGVSLDQGLLWFLLDASFSLSGFTLQLEGLGAGSTLSSFKPSFRLQGMGLAYTNPPLKIGGAFLNVPEDRLHGLDFEYQGAIVIEAADLAIGAVGAYGQKDGSPSMFIFAELDKTLGGPPYFIVTGFMGGFGFNRKLHIPEPDEIFYFPFIKGLTDPAFMGKDATPLAILDVLDGVGTDPSGKPYVAWSTAEMGQYWMAAGIQWTTFKIVNAHALAVVNLGSSLSVALIGLATVKLPQVGIAPFAYVELGIEAVLDLDEGCFRITAGLGPNSYILDPNLKLTGGFAFYTWFDGEHAGDLVVTIGGYHPLYTPPAHYPTPSRLGFQWQFSDKISIHGGAYFALTPSMIMAGGLLDLRFHEGNLQAWFTAKADFLMQWNPFYFTGEMSVSVGASYKLDVLGTSSVFKVELGASLSMWGPRIGGKVHVDWYIISFSIHFGAPKVPPQISGDWNTLAALLPAPEHITKISVNRGLSERTNDIWIVRPDELQFTTQSVIPSNLLYLNSEPAPHTDVTSDWKLDIRPLGKENLVSSHRVSLIPVTNSRFSTKLAPSAEVIDLNNWSPETISGQVPEALWGKPVSDNHLVPESNMLSGRLHGYTFSAPRPSTGASTPLIPMSNISYEELPGGHNPLHDPASPACSQPKESAVTVQTIADTLIKNASVRTAAQQAISRLQGVNLKDGSLTHMHDEASGLFREAPLLVQSGKEMP